MDDSNYAGLLVIQIIVWVVSVLVGYLIGEHKGRTTTGVILSLLLGFIGVIIIACLPKTLEKKAAELQYMKSLMKG